MLSLLAIYVEALERYRIRHRLDDAYFDDWSELVSETDMGADGYDSDDAMHNNVIEGQADSRRIQRAALLEHEHTRFMAFLAENGWPELYTEFEEALREEHARGDYPGVPVRDLFRF